MPLNMDPMWYKDAVFYELNVRAFADTSGNGHGDFQGMIDHLDHLQWLGVDCVWLLPFYSSPLFDDGYDIADYYSIAEPFGSLDEFKTMLDAYHNVGIRVITDLVVNHTSDQHAWFKEARSSRDNPKRDWYVWSDTPDKYAGTRVIFCDSLDSNWTYDEQTEQYYWHRFYSQQPDLNFDNPEVQEEMLNIMRYWLNMGLDGFRVDAIPYLFEREGTINENLPETYDYLTRMRHMVDAEFPGCILLGEANQPPIETQKYMESDKFHMGFHFPIMPRLYMDLAKGERTDIVKIMEVTPEIPPLAQWCMFLRNHDELTLEMVTDAEREWMWNFYAPDPAMKMNQGIRRRFAPLLGNDKRKMDLMNAILLSLPGSPIIYYGDEIGMGDDISLRDRNGVRTPMQWNASPNGGFSSADKTYEPAINDAVYGYTQVNVEAQQADKGSLLHTLCQQIVVRQAHQVFGRGEFIMLEPDNIAVLAYERLLDDVEKGASKILCLFNLSDSVQLVDFDLTRAHIDILSGQNFPSLQNLALKPYQFLWLISA